MPPLRAAFLAFVCGLLAVPAAAQPDSLQEPLVSLQEPSVSAQGAPPEPPTGLGFASADTVAVRLEGLGPRAASPLLAPDSLPVALGPAADSLHVRSVRTWRVAAVAGGNAALGLGVMEAQRRRWWEGRSPRFHFQNDWNYVLWTDKLGHFYAARGFTQYYGTTLQWAGLPEKRARLWGAGAAFTNMLFFEVLDGFGPQWGFSTGDLLFNTLGVGYGVAQGVVPVLEAVHLKASYYPSGWEDKNITDDYAGQTWWLTVNPHRLGARRLPPWLSVAAGYAARERDEWDFLTERHVFVGLDIEPAGLPIRGKVWEAMVPWPRLIHFPAPAVRITPRPRFFVFGYSPQ